MFSHLKHPTLADLRQLDGYTKLGIKTQSPLYNHTHIMQGNWFYHSPTYGLSFHCGQVRELENLQVSTELPAGLSFNLLYQGEVSFTLANQPHVIRNHEPQPQGNFFALNKAEILTRYLCKDSQLTKLNIFVERTWLAERTQSPQEHKMLKQAFRNHAQLQTWLPSEQVLHKAAMLIALNHEQAYAHTLATEAAIIELLSLCLRDLYQQSHPAIVDTQPQTPKNKLCQRCKQLIDDNQTADLSLLTLASQLNVSISTLQRHFKAAFGMTVADYIRQKKLELARRALLQDGLSISEAAYLAGYNHTANFVAAFKRQYALSPASYRKQYQGQGNN